MSNPYQVLGVPETASDEEIKKAYRRLAKQYHPDNYVDNPLKDLADQKMKEINEAYDAIQKMRSSGSAYSGARPGTGASNTAGAQSAGGIYGRIRTLISTNRFSEAQVLLERIEQSERTAEWHFLYSVIMYRSGWMQNARDEINLACSMDPYNREYMAFRQQMNSGASSSPYAGMNTNRSGNGDSFCSCCSSLLCADCCCECMGGDCVPCC